MVKDREFVGRVYKNIANNQFNIQPTTRTLSPELLKLFNNPTVIGLKLEIVEILDKMPKPKKLTHDELKLKWRDYNKRRKEDKMEEDKKREKKLLVCKKYYQEHREELIACSRVNKLKNKEHIKEVKRLYYLKQKEGESK